MEILTTRGVLGSACIVRQIASPFRSSNCRGVWICKASLTSTVTQEDRLTAAKDMTSWLEEQGFPQQPLSLSIFPDKGLGFCASQDLQAGDVALSIPENYTVTAVDVASHPVIANAAQGRNDLIGLTLWFMYERNRSRDSPWFPYLKVFPASTSSPLLWTASEQEELLGGSPALDKVKKQLTALEQEYDALKEHLNSREEFPAESFSFDAFKAAFSVVLSRAIYLPSAELWALVPFGDLLNHESSRKSLDYDSEDQTVTSTPACYRSQSFNEFIYQQVKLKLDKSYKKGEQVFTSYVQNQSNADLLIRYGFVDDGNKDDCIEIEVDLVSGDPLRSLKRDILQEAGLGVPQKFPLYLDRFPTQLLTYTRLARIQDSLLFTKIRFDKDMIVDQRNEYEALMLLMGDCRTKLSNYKGTAEDELQLLKRKNLSAKEMLSAKLRLKEKTILTETLSALRNRLAPIRGLPAKSGGLQDPNSDIKEMFDMIEKVIAAPNKFVSDILRKNQ